MLWWSPRARINYCSTAEFNCMPLASPLPDGRRCHPPGTGHAHGTGGRLAVTSLEE
eukprot:COSAG02_NODE_7261_length_3092_cov_5.086201_3_plen_56_part_00